MSDNIQTSESNVTALTKHEPHVVTFAPVDPMVSMIERILQDPAADMAKLERMLDLRERIQQQEARKAFDQAIAAAKSEIGPIRKNHHVSFTNDKGKTTEYKHETLAEVERTVAPVLARFGLHYRYRVQQDMEKGGLIAVTCILAHRDGHFEETTLQSSRDDGPGRNNFQAVASAVTYLKRYSLMAILGLSSEADEEDDDGRGAVPAAGLTEDQFRVLRDLLERDGSEPRFLQHYGIGAVHELPAARFEEAAAALRRRIANKAGA